MSLLVYILFFVSGACGLVYEVTWSRMLVPVFGRSTLAVGTVLAAFMWGLAIGSYLLGRYTDRSRNPLRLYGLIEVGIGVSACAASYVLGRVTPLYVWAHGSFGEESLALTVVRFFLAFLPLVVPTLLMGATLPILSRLVIRRLSCVERDLGRLYAINTVGAVAGSLAAGFLLIRLLGLHGTIYAAVAGNVAVGLAALAASASRRTSDDTVAAAAPAAAETDAPAAEKTGDDRTACILVLGAFALSGFASFAYEIFWTRSLVFVVGNTTYAFSLMLTAFLSGIALGGYGIRFAANRVRNHLRLFAAIQVLIGLLSAASLPVLFGIIRSRWMEVFVSRMSDRLGFLAVSDFAVALLVMLVPATLIGATLPLVGRVFLDDLKSTGRTVGKVYAVNTVGNVLGALLPGLLIMPLLGIQKGILLMAILNLCLGAVVAFSHRRHAFLFAGGAAGVFVISAVCLLQVPLPFHFPSEAQTVKDEVLYYREGGLVTTKVWASSNLDYKSISVDGINIGGTSDSDYKQQLLAHLPKLLLPSYSSELSIGLGSGILAGESLRHAGVRRLVCVEISRGVVEGARFFTRENYGVVDDPRTAIVTDDITDFLQTSGERFDIISADEKTVGKFATNSMSYSTDYYALLRRHLAPGGLVIQWMPADLPPAQFTLAMRTFAASFPHVSAWYFPPVGRFTMSNTILVGSDIAVAPDVAAMRQALQRDPQAFRGVRKYGLATAEDFLAHYVASDETLRRALPVGPLNSFEHPYYEFYSPRDYAVPAAVRALPNHRLLTACRGGDFDAVVSGVAAADREPLRRACEAEGMFLAAYGVQLQGGSPAELLSAYDAALLRSPGSRNLAAEFVSYLNSMVRERAGVGDIIAANEYLHRAAQILPESAETHFDYAMMLLYVGRAAAGETELQKSLQLDPEFVPALRNLAGMHAAAGNLAAAVQEWRKALEADPDDIGALLAYGSYLVSRGAAVDGFAYIRRAYRLAPENPDVIRTYVGQAAASAGAS